MAETIADLFSIVSSVLMALTMGVYIRQVTTSQSTPNPVTYLVLSVVCTMNTISFSAVTHYWLTWLTTLVSATGILFVFLYALVRGTFGRIGYTDVICLLIAIVAGVLWQWLGGKWANIALQSIYVIVTVPIVVGLLKKRLREHKTAWDLAVASYMCMILGIVINWHENSLFALVHPVINGLCTNGAVAITIRYVEKKRPRLCLVQTG